MLNGLFTRKSKNTDIALLLVDMQNSFLKGMTSKETNRILYPQLNVLDYCIKEDIPVVVLEFISESATHRLIRKKTRKVPRSEKIKKCSDSGFRYTNLAEKLESWKIGCVCLAGINSHACVKSTAKSALEYGLRITTSKDIIGGFSSDGNATANDWFRKKSTYYENHEEMLVGWNERKYL